MNTPPNLAFESVKNAYKLLEDYHRRVLDTLRLLRDGLNKDLEVTLTQISWGRPYVPEQRTDILRLSDPPTGMLLPFCAALYMTLASDVESKPGSFVVELSHPGKDDDGGLKQPRFEVFMKVIPTNAVVKGDTVRWAERATRFDEEFEHRPWHDGVVHEAKLDGIKVAYGGFSVDAADLPTEKLVREKLTEPLVALIRGALRRAMK